MPKRKKFNAFITIEQYAAEGKGLGRLDGKAIFVSKTVPGDKVEVFISSNKKNWAEGKVLQFIEYSPLREKPFCKHFNICGGCNWQMLTYKQQLQYKQQEIEGQLNHIGGLDLPPIFPIIGSEKTTAYRNKIEFSFSVFPFFEKPKEKKIEMPVLGFHAPKFFDKIIDIDTCYLMDNHCNEIRNFIRKYAIEQGYTFYNPRTHEGFLRNIILRNSTLGQWMINIIFGENNSEKINLFLKPLLPRFSWIDTIVYTINTKFNDSIYDLYPILIKGNGYIEEKLKDFTYRISPKSFFQTNTLQAEKLYQIVEDFLDLKHTEIVYDLYCGTGSIGIFLSKKAKKIIGIELLQDAIQDAIQNSSINKLQNTTFFTGDAAKICNDDLFQQNGFPDAIVVDPPRGGLNPNLIQTLLKISSPKIVYVSCNPATQARDLKLLQENYRITKVQPLDIFPHTYHTENVVLLEKK
ncbi:MAG: 23S rRNA (uracil(1939)-C(5))-methyltransferase RlmD [Chitinophagaceae bacterium]